MKSEQLGLLKCPATHQPLTQEGNYLITVDGKYKYSLTDSGIVLFASDFITDDAKIQSAHFDKVAQQYFENLEYPHTKEYMAYLDCELLKVAGERHFSNMSEICCGTGESFHLLKDQFDIGVGIDISVSMLELAQKTHQKSPLLFVQGDATHLPIEENALDLVMMLGGIHHVNDRIGLFSEINRVLKDDGVFLWREPVDDFFLWRWIRKVIYRISPSLDAETEAPLRYKDTYEQLEKAGLTLDVWKTSGFFGFCIFMNSDILIFNKLFKFVPGIRKLVVLSARFDSWLTSLPFLKKSGLIVNGKASKLKA